MQAKPKSNPKGPTFSQDKMSASDRKKHNSAVRAEMAQKEAITQTLDNHANLCSPYTAKTVMEGVAIGMGDVTAGVIVAKVIKGAKAVAKANSAASETKDVFRVFGGDSKADGFSWTTENPNNASNFRDAAGLPSGVSGGTNTGQFVIEGTVNNADIITTKPALPLDGSTGGIPELLIDPKNVKINRISGANPPF